MQPLKLTVQQEKLLATEGRYKVHVVTSVETTHHKINNELVPRQKLTLQLLGIVRGTLEATLAWAKENLSVTTHGKPVWIEDARTTKIVWQTEGK
jgi:hypothetical protein